MRPPERPHPSLNVCENSHGAGTAALSQWIGRYRAFRSHRLAEVRGFGHGDGHPRPCCADPAVIPLPHGLPFQLFRIELRFTEPAQRGSAEVRVIIAAVGLVPGGCLTEVDVR